MSLLISMSIAKIRMPRLELFLLYNLPAWLKNRYDGADVDVMPRSSRAAAAEKGNDVRFSSTLKQIFPNIFF